MEGASQLLPMRTYEVVLTDPTKSRAGSDKPLDELAQLIQREDGEAKPVFEDGRPRFAILPRSSPGLARAAQAAMVFNP